MCRTPASILSLKIAATSYLDKLLSRLENGSLKHDQNPQPKRPSVLPSDVQFSRLDLQDIM